MWSIFEWKESNCTFIFNRKESKQSLTKIFCRSTVVCFSRQRLWKLNIFVEGCWVCFWEEIFVVRQIYLFRISMKFSWQCWFWPKLSKAETEFECLWTLGGCWEAVVDYCQVCFDSKKGFQKWLTAPGQTNPQTHKVCRRADASSTSVMGALRAPLTGQRREEVAVVVLEKKVVVVGVVVD